MEVNFKMENNELMHHGIFGMKWGIRRYQNKDGSLTAAGRKRIAKLDAERERITSGNKSSSSSGSKKMSDMSNEELRARIERTRLESDYINANRQLAALTPKETKKGAGFIKKTWNNIIEPAATSAGKKVLDEWLTKVGKDALGLNKKGVEDGLAALKKEAATLKTKKEIDGYKEYFKNKKEKKKREKESRESDDSEESESKSDSKNTKSDERKTYTGTVMDDEPSSRASSGREYTRTSTIYDVPFEDVTDRYSSSGQSYVASLESSSILALPAPKR